MHQHRTRYTLYIVARSDDRNDSNHRLTSGIRHSGFRVATPAAIVAVYDCRARSPSPSANDSSSSSSSSFISSSPPCLLVSFSLPLYPVFVPTRTRGRSDFLVPQPFLRVSSPRFSLPRLRSFLFSPRSLAPCLSPFLSPRYLSSYPSRPLPSYLLLVSSVLLARARFFFLLLALVPGLCLPLACPLSILRAIDRIPERNDEAEIYVYAFACATFAVVAVAAAAAAAAAVAKQRAFDRTSP